MKILALLNHHFLMMLPIVVAIVLAIGNADAAPYQELEPRKGFVPVYIRYGDTPLSEIHPKLAEAFKEDANAHVGKIESADLIEMKDESADKSTQKEANTTAAAAAAGSTISEKSDQVSTDASKEKASDIASFDVVKGTSNNGEN